MLEVSDLNETVTVDGVITGTVTDPYGAVVPGANVTVTNTAGNYTVTVKASGFKIFFDRVASRLSR